MKTKLTLLLIICIGLDSSAQFLELSERAEILVITASPGQEQLYSAFGHSAFRVVDPITGIDWVYNYGTFNFNRPNFYLNFARGHLIYQLSKGEYQRFKEIYVYYNRTLNEQILNLDLKGKQRLFEFLENNALPENKDYFYDYFYNNCATKLRDVLYEVFGDSIRFDGSHITTHYSLRYMVDLYTKYQPWGDLGIDICLGLPMDKVLSSEEYMFLPDYIYQGFGNAYLTTTVGEVPLIAREVRTNVANPVSYTNSFFTPKVVFWGLLLLGILITYVESKKGKWYKAFDVLLFFILGFIGWFLLGLWFLTDHASQWNFNLMWAIPFHLPLAFMLVKKEPGLFVKKYFQYVFYFTLFLLGSWYFLPQAIHTALIPMAILGGVRGYKIYRLK